MSKSLVCEPCKNPWSFCPSRPKVVFYPAPRGGSGRRRGVDSRSPVEEAFDQTQKSMSECDIVRDWFWVSAGALYTDVGPLWTPFGQANIMISLTTSSKNAVVKKRRSKNHSKGPLWLLLHCLWPPEDLKRDPQNDPKTTVCAQNTVNNQVFYCLQYSLLLFPRSEYPDQSFNTDSSKHALWLVSGRFWGSNEPPKVVISLRTSFKNRFYKHFASRTSSKPLLDHFWVVLSPPMRPKAGRQGGSTNHGFRLPQAFDPFQQSIGLQDPPPTPSQV